MKNLLTNSPLNVNYFSQETTAILMNARIIDKVFYKKKNALSANENRICISLEVDQALPFFVYNELTSFFTDQFLGQVDLSITSIACELDEREIKEYGKLFDATKHQQIFSKCNVIVEHHRVTLLSGDQYVIDSGQSQVADIVAFFSKAGISYQVLFKYHEVTIKMNEIQLNVVEPPQVKQVEVPNKKSYRPTAYKNYTMCPLYACKEEMTEVKVRATVSSKEVRVLRNNKTLCTLIGYDEQDALKFKVFEGRAISIDEINGFKDGQEYEFYGDLKIDHYSFDKEIVFEVRRFEKIDSYEAEIIDDAKVKRVELHTHTNKSEMDGVVPVEQLIKHAFSLGHRGIAITDHAVVQAFPKAQGCARGLLKANPDRDFKVVYGAELYVVDQEDYIVYQPKPAPLLQSRYCVFDIETTGLSVRHNEIIEFGGVIIEHGEVVDRLQLFIDPQCKIPMNITELTGISTKDVEGQPLFKDVVNQILNFMEGSILVAHNATFDVDFINEKLQRIGMDKLQHPIIDTLALARALYPNRKSNRLGAIARFLSISYDSEGAHRADYDAEVLAQVLQPMFTECRKREIDSIDQLNLLQTKEIQLKNFKQHVCVLAKNQAGLKNLFELISLSHTDTLLVTGKANSKESDSENLAVPCVFKQTLNEYRENLLIGSACLNGEVFDTAFTKSQDALDDAVSFFDYIEIQPLENYRQMVDEGKIDSMDHLRKILTWIIESGKRQGKIVVASGDVHYVHPKQKLLRDIFINTMGIGGARHPLYIMNDVKRKNIIAPNQHFYTTPDMLKAFSWLDPDLAYEIVVTNSNAILDDCEVTKPVHDDLYPPKIEGADQLLTDICYKTAQDKYGDFLPAIVEARLKKELDSILGNGFGVIYYISHLLVKKSNDDGYLVGSRGSVGSSFVATMSGITEVNPLAPHYSCTQCKYSEFITDGSIASGYDLVSKECPKCGFMMNGEGQDIPFETFLGFEGDKVPDIDLNFSGEYQERAFAYIREVLGEKNVFRAGTIGTVAEKTAVGYVLGYFERKEVIGLNKAFSQHLAKLCEGVKRTTGQHPGGIIAIPDYMDVHDFTPVNFPANNTKSEWLTTHFEFHDIHDNVLKFDILGHVDPTAMRMLQNISGIDPKTIPMNDKETMSLFSTSYALQADPKYFNEKTGAIGLPEFGTNFVRKMLELTKPATFSDLVIISGLSHGTDVWLNNAKDLVENQIATLQEVIGCRDDIMTYLIHSGLEPKQAFTIMESVRKGKGVRDEWIESMKSCNVPDWYIESCRRIKYMFPKAHAVAYVIMAVRIAWFKVHHPHYYYACYFSLRCDAFEIETMSAGYQKIQARMDDIASRMNAKEKELRPSTKEIQLISTFESCIEMLARGYRMGNIDLYESDADNFTVSKTDKFTIVPPFTVIDGLGYNVAKSIVDERVKAEFLSKEDIVNRTALSTTLLNKLDSLGVLAGMQDRNQMSLF